MGAVTLLGEVDMKLASLAILGSLLINMAFALVIAGAISARPAIATALNQCARHASSATTHRPADGHYLAAVRMGWVVG
jgi:hypothetical protein